MTQYYGAEQNIVNRSRKAKKKRGGTARKVLLIAVPILAVCLCLLLAGIRKTSASRDAEGESAGIVSEENALTGNAADSVMTDEAAESAADVSSGPSGESLTKLSEIRKTVLDAYPWDIRVRCEGHEPETFTLSNLIEKDIDELSKTIFAGYESGNVQDSYQLEPGIDDDRLATDITVMNYLWSKPAVNSSITGYSVETGTFSFSEPEAGYAIDEDKLRSDIMSAINDGDYSRVIDVEMVKIEPEIGPEEARSLYKTISTFITHSTANPDRNNNLRLACEAIDGKYLAPGESFSFNLTTGQRTKEKGYKDAGAYQNGVTVQEPGGGVCQVASTLYNAVIKAGLKVTERHAHTYEPSYVTPGEDATVSYDGYDGPDMVFVNNSKAGIVIRASYADQEVACSIIGIPILAEDETISMHSERVAEMDQVIQYNYDETLPAGEQVVSSNGTRGSRWETYLKHTKGGNVISDELLHTSQYNGHAKVIRVGTAVAAEPEPLPVEQQYVTGIHGGPGVFANGNIVHGGPGTVPIEANDSGTDNTQTENNEQTDAADDSGETSGEE